jgi:hypothetical protein
MTLWPQSGSSAHGLHVYRQLRAMSMRSGWPLLTPVIVWWIIRFSIGFSEDGSIHVCRGWQLMSFQFPLCLPSRSEYSALQDRWLQLKGADSKRILSEQLNVSHRGRKVGLSKYPNRSKLIQIKSNQIKFHIFVSKSNQIGGWI